MLIVGYFEKQLKKFTGEFFIWIKNRKTENFGESRQGSAIDFYSQGQPQIRRQSPN